MRYGGTDVRRVRSGPAHVRFSGNRNSNERGAAEGTESGENCESVVLPLIPDREIDCAFRTNPPPVVILRADHAARAA